MSAGAIAGIEDEGLPLLQILFKLALSGRIEVADRYDGNHLAVLQDRHVPVLENGEVIAIVSIRDLYAAAKRELEEDLQQREAFIFDTGYGTG